MKRTFCIFILLITILSYTSISFSKEDYNNKTYKLQEAEGNYIGFGALSLQTIKRRSLRESLNNLSYTIYSFFDENAVKPNTGIDTDFDMTINSYTAMLGADYRGGKLFIKYGDSYSGSNTGTLTTSAILIPSVSIKGDWDCVYSGFTGDTPYTVPSFLHRVNDKRIVEYFTLSAREANDDLYLEQTPKNIHEKHKFPQRMRDIANELAKDYPEDYYIRLIYYDFLLRDKNIQKLEEDLLKNKEHYLKPEDPYMNNIYTICQRAILAEKLSKENLNAYDFLIGMLYRGSDFETRKKKLPETMKYSDCLIIRNSLEVSPYLNFLEYQITAKIFYIDSVFSMLQGKRDEAAQNLLSVFRIGDFCLQGENVLSHLIGAAVKTIALKGIGIFALNCCETKDELNRFLKKFDETDANSVENDFDKAVALASIEIPFIENIQDNYSQDAAYLADYSTRIKSVIAVKSSLRFALGAKEYLLQKNRFPKDDNELSSIFPQGFPTDPYSKAPIRYLTQDNLFTAYSIGPDEKDDGAVFEYDPTNGTKSAGDIIYRAPAKREYPFPKSGIKANSADEIAKRFPNGLPPDTFADRRTSPISISKTKPVYIYSYGPDTDETEVIRKGENYFPEIRYDPTNGTVSRGDLFFTVETKK